jgi:hypothetical protein
MSGTGNDQNLTDEQILAKLQATADGELPGDDGDDAGSADEHEKKIRHAFAEKKRAAKEALTLAEKYKKEAEELRKGSSHQPTTPATTTAPAAGGDAQARQILTRLTMQAMQSLGFTEITEANQELVRMERDRLYIKLGNDAESRREAEVNASGVIESVLEDITSLDSAGATEVKKRLNSLDALQRVNPSVIRKVVSEYLGEQIMSGNFTPPSTNGQGGDDEDDLTGVALRGKTTATAAGASAVKNGRTGVRPGKQQDAEQPKPATPAEVAEMKKYGMSDLKAYRLAKVEKAKYMGR